MRPWGGGQLNGRGAGHRSRLRGAGGADRHRSIRARDRKLYYNLRSLQQAAYVALLVPSISRINRDLAHRSVSHRATAVRRAMDTCMLRAAAAAASAAHILLPITPTTYNPNINITSTSASTLPRAMPLPISPSSSASSSSSFTQISNAPFKRCSHLHQKIHPATRHDHSYVKLLRQLRNPKTMSIAKSRVSTRCQPSIKPYYNSSMTSLNNRRARSMECYDANPNLTRLQGLLRDIDDGLAGQRQSLNHEYDACRGMVVKDASSNDDVISDSNLNESNPDNKEANVANEDEDNDNGDDSIVIDGDDRDGIPTQDELRRLQRALRFPDKYNHVMIMEDVVDGRDHLMMHPAPTTTQSIPSQSVLGNNSKATSYTPTNNPSPNPIAIDEISLTSSNYPARRSSSLSLDLGFLVSNVYDDGAMTDDTTASNSTDPSKGTDSDSDELDPVMLLGQAAQHIMALRFQVDALQSLVCN